VGVDEIGIVPLYVVLATIGSKTDLSAAAQSPRFILFGVVVLAIHGALMLMLGRVYRVPLFLLSTASQANVGGPISAPIVAEVYQPGYGTIGVIMASSETSSALTWVFSDAGSAICWKKL